MSTDRFELDGRVYSWRRIREMRRQQTEARKAAGPAQPALFALKHDCRPASERCADRRYAEPSLLDRMQPSD